MAVSVQIVVKVNATTLAALKDMGYALYGLKGFKTTSAQGKAMVWIETSTYADNTALLCTTEYQAFIETTPEQAGGTVITRGVSADVELGDIATVAASGELAVAAGGYPAGVTIKNGGTTPYSAGLSAKNPAALGGFAPFAEVPLRGLADAIVAPTDQLLITFSTGGLRTGQALPYSMSQSLLIDAQDGTEFEATFDIDAGWSWGGAPWGQTVASGTSLNAVLVSQAPLLADA